MQLDSLAVDSVITAFNLGVQAGTLTFAPVVAGAIAIVVVIHLISYAVSKS